MPHCRILNHNLFFFNRKIFLLLCSLFLFGFLNADIVFADKYKFKSYSTHRCFKKTLIPFSKLDSSMKDVTVECNCYQGFPPRPSLPSRTKIYYTEAFPEDKAFIYSWIRYVRKYGGDFYVYHFKYDPNQNNNFGKKDQDKKNPPDTKYWKLLKWEKTTPNFCAPRLKALKDQYRNLAAQKRNEENEKNKGTK